MHSGLSNHLKTARAGIALLGIATMLSLSACGSGSNEKEPISEPTASASIAPAPTEGVNEDVVTGVEEPNASDTTPTEEAVTGDDETSYPAPDAELKTSVGEPIKDAEARFLTASKTRVENAGSDDKILAMGYETCEYYGESTTQSEFFDKLEAASNGDHDTEVNYLYISGAASKTICPEFADF